ncbi:DNA polymerase I [Planctomicrobium sp. SH668]|uniref:DNA polymerase I n=1 Tax=Planctomicrobium sp. SH668 TaxID=3448126 RepID=UPI003F5C24C0
MQLLPEIQLADITMLAGVGYKSTSKVQVSQALQFNSPAYCLSMSDTLYIVDTFSLVFQVYHAIRQPMTGTRGQPTNAVYGIVGDIEHLLRDKKPSHLIFAMESADPGERLAIYSDYKANRSGMPDDLRPQIPLILDVLDGYNIPVVSCSGWEADDVIATMATEAAKSGLNVRIVSSDKDLRQLIEPRVKVYHIRKKQFMDEQHLMEEWGIAPNQVVDFQSLVGDSVDNVPGVPGIGPKTARTLIEKFGTLENVLANADQAPGKKVIENLKNFKDQALMSRELVRLRTDLPLDLNWESYRLKPRNSQKLYELFTDFGFRRYAADVQADVIMAAPKKSEIVVPNFESRKWSKIETLAQFEKFTQDLQQQSTICVDLETTSKDPLHADIVGWAVSWKPGEAYYLAVNGPAGTSVLDPQLVQDAMKPILEDPAKTITNQNIKYDWLVLRRVGIEIANVGMDPMIGDYLLDAGARSHGMDELSKKYLFHEMIPISDLIGKGKKQLKMFEVEVDRAAEYATEDADVALQLATIIEGKLEEEGLSKLFWELERPLISVLVDMEWNGVRINVDELKRQSAAATLRLQSLMNEIHQLAGSTFNIDSPKQLGKVLFEDLKLPVQKRTKTGPSTDQEVLEKLAEIHPLPKLLIEHRMLTKLNGTYLQTLPQLVHPQTNSVHTSFSQVTAATGRLSSSDPNLQNIPVRTEEGRLIRRAFVASRPEWKLVCLDYSQIELRMLAHYCQDPAMLESFRKGEDIHASVAAQVYGVPVAEVSREQRSVAKAVNFGVIYGQTSYGLSATLGIPQAEAAQFIDDYFAKYSAVDSFVQTTLSECRRTGYAKTILGRRREIQGIRPRVFGNLNLPERTAVNAVIQGSAADLIKQAMINVHAKLKGGAFPARMLLQIHDELVFETPGENVGELIRLARHEMSNALKLDVPIEVDAKFGDNWLDTQPYRD